MSKRVRVKSKESLSAFTACNFQLTIFPQNQKGQKICILLFQPTPKKHHQQGRKRPSEPLTNQDQLRISKFKLSRQIFGREF